MKIGRREQDERAAVLPLFAIFLFVFLVVAALAVDLSAMERRGQTLQNTADAAALAGVAVWQETGDSLATQQRISDMLRQNGLVVGDDLQVVVNPIDADEIEVIIRDTDPDVFLGGIVEGFGGVVERGASARLIDCEDDCNIIVDLPTPFPPTSVIGSGDGYYPVAVGNRFYAINHDGDKIACVDRETASQCWSDQLAPPFRGPVSGPVSHAVNVDTRIFWTAQEAGQLTMFCWQTVNERPCSRTVPIAPLYRAEDLGVKWQQRGGGVIAVGSRVFVFTDDHHAHCVNAITLSACGGYVGGKPTGMNKLGFDPLDPADGESGSNIDRVLNETNGRIYHTLHIRESAANEGQPTGVFIDCWDTTTDNTCDGFSPAQIHATSQRQFGRLFLHRNASGYPTAVCSTGPGDVQCVDFFGDEASGVESTYAPLVSRLPSLSEYEGGMGVHYYHEESNRLILTTPRRLSTIHCWDFSTSGYCGSLYGFANGSETQDYGFVSEGNCIYGLGHNSVFWAFTSDMTPGCPGATVNVDVGICDCGGVARWGDVGFNFDIGPDSPFVVLNLRALDADGNQVFPTNGDKWISMIGRPSDVLSLNAIPTDIGPITLQVYLETDGSTDPWEAETPPALLFGFREIPFLTS